MRAFELYEKDLIGKQTPSAEEIAKKHGVSVSRVESEIVKGIKVELEHTNNEAEAREISLDHLDEFIDYYDRLDKAEQPGFMTETLKQVNGKWALVSKSNPKKVLQYYDGPKGKRPSKEWVAKVERRVHSFEDKITGSNLKESLDDKIIAYHGTGASFDSFNDEFAIGTLTWFTDNKDLILQGGVGASSKGTIITAELDIKNPAGWKEYDKFGTDELIGRGYDGLKLEDDDQTTWVTFSDKQIKILDRETINEDEDSLKLPTLNVGDTLMVGKFKNRKAEIKGFKKDKNNQPIAKTNKGDQQIFKGRIKKLMPSEKLDEYRIEKMDIGNEDVVAMVDPEYKQLKRFADKSGYQELRGIYAYDTGSFYWWDAAKLIHNAAMKELGLSPKTSHRLELDKKWIDGEDRYVMDCAELLQDIMIANGNDYIKRNFDIIDEGHIVFALKE